MAASMPWLSGVDYKRLCTWFPYAALLLVLTRDKGSGRVTIGRDGLPRIHYWPDKHDRASMMDVSHPNFCKSWIFSSYKKLWSCIVGVTATTSQP